MKRKYWWFIGFFAVLMGAFYFFLFAGTEYYKVKLPVLTYVKDFHLQTRMAKPCPKEMWMEKFMWQNTFLPLAKAFAPR